MQQLHKIIKLYRVSEFEISGTALIYNIYDRGKKGRYNTRENRFRV